MSCNKKISRIFNRGNGLIVYRSEDPDRIKVAFREKETGGMRFG